MAAGIKQSPSQQFGGDYPMLVRLVDDPADSESRRERIRAQDPPLVPPRYVHRILKNYPKMEAVDRNAEYQKQFRQPAGKCGRERVLNLS
jgi:hypothetical protein